MNYEKKYKQALDRARVLMTNQNPPAFDKHLIEIVFPELKESEDDRIKREIIAYINELADLKNEKIPTKWIAWLEKQKVTDEEIIFRPIVGTDIRIAAKQALEKINIGKKVVLAFNGAYISVNGKTVGEIDSEYDAWLKKQGGNKPTDNVEIKFCEGDKVVSNQDGKVYTVGTAYYVIGDGEDICLHDTDGNHLWTNRDDLNNDYHLWSINDAKDGDVLNSPSHRLIWIYKDNEHYHVCVNMNYVTKNIATDDLIKIPSDACPATKDERTILFEKMKEAGYEWDSKKKELNKIEQKSTDKTEPKFKVRDWILNDVCFPLQIASIRDGMYVFTKGDAISISFIDENYHLWSIKDAEDGDVLTANVQRGELGYDEYPFRYIPITFIYRKTDKDNYYIHSHCDMLCVDGVLNPSYRIFAEDFIKDIYPANKEQHDLLFQKMKEEGYEWDDKKKEVKTIEPKKLDADKVIEWLKNTIKERAENYGVYKETRLTLPYNSIEDLINDFKEDFGLC